MRATVADMITHGLEPFSRLLSEGNSRAVEVLAEAAISLLDADLLEPEERRRLGEMLERVDPAPGKPSAHLFATWERRWFSETNGERRP